MNVYPENRLIEIEVKVQSASGDAYLDECKASYKLLDVDSKVIMSGSSEKVQNSLKVSIPAEFNTLKEEATKDIRSLVVRFETPEGASISEVKEFYIIQSSNPLVVGLNSFVTIEKFKLLSSIIPKLDQFEKATEDQALNSLIASHEKLVHLRYRVYNTRVDLASITSKQYEELPEEFKSALEKAQVVEANAILAPTDDIEERRRKGVILETINEVKMMFSSSTPVKYPICESSMKILSPYLLRSMNIARA